jgi:hypothetical protein
LKPEKKKCDPGVFVMRKSLKAMHKMKLNINCQATFTIKP